MTDDTIGSSPRSPVPLEDLLGSLSLGPSWVREAGRPLVVPSYPDDERRGGQRSARFGDDRGRPQPRASSGQGWRRDGERRDRGAPRYDSRDYDDQRTSRPERVEPEEGVTVIFRPGAEAMSVLAKQIHHGARIYSLLDVAHLILGGRDRYRLVFRADASHRPLLRGRRDDSLWLGEAEAMAHFRKAAWRSELYREEDVEVDPPRGNFLGVARCGLCGEWIAPPNFHAYQAKLRQIHRERFPQMSFERYLGHVRVERGEEAVQQWVASMTKRRQWRPVEEAHAETILTSEADLDGHFRHHSFDAEFRPTHEADLPGTIAGELLSPPLVACLRSAGNHVRNHPAMLIPTLCQMLDKLHVPIFKRDGKLFTGPSRPHPIGPDVDLSERPAAILGWARENPGAKLPGLWGALLPEGCHPPPPEWAADFLWLLHQGHLLLTKEDRLLIPGVEGPAKPQEAREGQRSSGRGARTSGPSHGHRLPSV